jgi:ammonia channel protein AmtB
VLTQTLVISCIVMVVWALWGYSMAFTDGGSLNAYVGGFSKALLKGVDTSTVSGASARWTSPAAPWCTSMPVSPPWWARSWWASVWATTVSRWHRTR